MSSPSLLGASCQAARLNSERFLGAVAVCVASVASVMTAPPALGACVLCWAGRVTDASVRCLSVQEQVQEQEGSRQRGAGRERG
jgi:hypothetical protein